MKKVEILAPGGSKEAICAAIHCGADAVYTGTDRFSARAFADNPTVEEMCEILDFAHLHDKKIYLTANTLLTEDELEGSFYAQIRPLYESGLDAVIVQDFGVMDFVREHFPGLDIHASTQMTLLTGEAGELLRPYGVTRLVPSRELTIDEIAQMRAQTNQELEVFVHGALCYCYSGQCRMSEVIGGRSGNRGMCAQPCRLPYAVEAGQGFSGADGLQKPRNGYFLSPKDMCTLGRVGELIRAGVDSFKIEGRMKKPAYAALTSHLYRIYADAALAGHTVPKEEVRRDVLRLADIYNRGGFSEGYLFAPSKRKLIDTTKNGHYGVCVGEVVKVGSGEVCYRVTEPLNARDVVEFRGKNGECAYEYTLGAGAEASEYVTARCRKGSPIRVGQKVYRTKNGKLLAEIADMIESGRGRKIPVSGSFTAVCGSPVCLELRGQGCVCRVTGAVAERAKGRPVTASDIEKRLRKTGESEFEFGPLTVQVPEDAFVPLGSIASLRRQGFEELRASICGEFHRPQLPAEKPIAAAAGSRRKPVTEDAAGSGENPDFLIVSVTNFRHIRGVKSGNRANAQNTRFHLKLDEFAPEEWGRLCEQAGGFTYYVSLPAVLRTKNAERFLERWCSHGDCFTEGSCVGVIVNSLEALPVLARMKRPEGWELVAGHGLYCWNRRTAGVYREFGIRKKLWTAYGRTAVMTTEGCVLMELGGCQAGGRTQRHINIMTPKKDEFSVVNYCDYCYNVIYEKKPSWHGRTQDASSRAGNGITYIPEIAFSFEDAAKVREVMEQWNFLS